MKVQHGFIMSAIGLFAAASKASPIDATITADNHYGVYSLTGGVFTFEGGGEQGARGGGLNTHSGGVGSTGGGRAVGSGGGTSFHSSGIAPLYNWSEAESYSFEAGDAVYIAAWSDNSVAQGLLAELSVGGSSVLSGDARWSVFATFEDLGDGDPAPTAAAIAARVAFADAGGLWDPIVAGANNGGGIWGQEINGISTASRWMWRDNGQADPFIPGNGTGEYLIFRMVVPAPGAGALLGLAGVAGLRRKR